MKYHIQTIKGDTIISNLDPIELEVANKCTSESEQFRDSTGQIVRHGKKSINSVIIYLATDDKKITGKIFKKYH